MTSIVLGCIFAEPKTKFMGNNKSLNHQYNNAAEIIKTAILQTQYEASKDINRIQLGLYFGIGKFLSEKTRNAKWGTEALQTITINPLINILSINIVIDKIMQKMPIVNGVVVIVSIMPNIKSI